MRDLSIRFMGAGDERLRRTLELNRGLAPTTGRVPTLNFPQGKFAQGKTPRVSKQKVHHLYRASICEVVFRDTFESGDNTYLYGQAFVDYRSRYGDIVPLKSRTEVAWALGEFCCRNFVPLDFGPRQQSRKHWRRFDDGMPPAQHPKCFFLPHDSPTGPSRKLLGPHNNYGFIRNGPRGCSSLLLDMGCTSSCIREQHYGYVLLKRKDLVHTLYSRLRGALP